MDADATRTRLPESAPDLEWPTGRLLSLAARLVEHAWAARLEEQGLSHAGFMALHALSSGDLPLRALAERCGVTAQTMTRTVDRLERAGHVRRTRNLRDRRSLTVSSTPAGDAAFARALRLAHTEDELLGAFVDHTRLRTDLLAVIDHLGGSHLAPGP